MRIRNAELNLERRAAILRAASELFVERGFHATAMKEICIAAGMSPGTVYHYFNSKTNIIAGIIEDEAQVMREIAAEISTQDNVMIALFAALDDIVQTLSERDLALHAEITAEVLRQPALLSNARLADDETLAVLSDAIAHSQEAGKIDRTIDPHTTAVLIGALIDGLFWRATLRGPGALLPLLPPLKEAIARMLGAPERTA